MKEAVFALAYILERMKKRGFDTQEIADKLNENSIVVKAPTPVKYLSEFRCRKGRKKDMLLSLTSLLVQTEKSAPRIRKTCTIILV